METNPKKQWNFMIPKRWVPIGQTRQAPTWNFQRFFENHPFSVEKVASWLVEF